MFVCLSVGILNYNCTGGIVICALLGEVKMRPLCGLLSVCVCGVLCPNSTRKLSFASLASDA